MLKHEDRMAAQRLAYIAIGDPGNGKSTLGALTGSACLCTDDLVSLSGELYESAIADFLIAHPVENIFIEGVQLFQPTLRWQIVHLMRTHGLEPRLIRIEQLR